MLSSEDDIVNHYKQQHEITRENSPAFNSYVDSLQGDPLEFFIEKCSYCHVFLFDAWLKSRHILKKHLKILNTSQVNNMIVRRIGNWFIEFSVDYHRFSKVFEFSNPEKIIFDFIENVSRKIRDANGEFCLICCIVNQSPLEIEGRKIDTNSCFKTSIIQGAMSDRVKDFLYLNTKERVLVNGENGSSVYFYRFDFLKILFLTSHLANYINLLS